MSEETKIKIDQIRNMQIKVAEKPIISQNKVYIINDADKMNVASSNALLKFLEEPGKEIYAFLTTNNESMILPTIVSRCQTLHLKLSPRKDVIENSINLDVARQDAELLSYFYNDEELLKDASETNEYHDAKDSLLTLLNDLIDNKSKAIYTMQLASALALGIIVSTSVARIFNKEFFHKNRNKI